MFWKKNDTMMQIVSPTIPQPLAHPVGTPVTTIPLEENERCAYEKIATSLGFEPAALLEARLLAFFRERAIVLYENKEVYDYLTTQARTLFGQWGIWWWRPLRDLDIAPDMAWGDLRWDGQYSMGVGYYRGGSGSGGRMYHPECRPYFRAVPLRVLVNVEKIAQAFGDKVKFFVTDIGDVRDVRPGPGDPFIGVTAPNMRLLIFDSWDEPSFTG